MAHVVRARLTLLAQVNFASMKCVVALALALTAQAIEIDWRIPGAEQLPPVTVDPATDGETITFKWSFTHNVYEMPSAAAMDGGVGLRGPREPGGRRRGRDRLRALDIMFILGSRPAPERPSPFPLPRVSYRDV